MGNVLQHFLIAGAAVSMLAAGPVGRFYPDDPITAIPVLASVDDARPRSIDPLYDFLKQSLRADPRSAQPAQAVNTLGEVPDSSWYTNRHATQRMTLDQLRRGPGNANPPEAPFQVIGAKTEGITPGFTMRDSRGRVYFVKPDPASNPEMATAAELIGSKFFFALGYFTAENYIVYFRPSDLSISDGAKLRGLSGRKRRMSRRDLDRILEQMPRSADGKLRVVASLQIPGKPLGPFKYEGTRSDDPNDVVSHERRRDLRGLHVLSAWLNHTDAKAGNSFDVLVRENGRGFLRHYLIDFGSILGSDSDMPKNARFGHEHLLPKGHDALKRMLTFGFAAAPWESIRYPDLDAVGRFEATMFDPEQWKSNYPNPAFVSRQPDDEYWAAKLVMAFSNDEIRAVVETGEYSDPAVTAWITATLIARRDQIGKVYFNKVLALDRFRIEEGELRFDDLRALHGFGPPRRFEFQWHTYDNVAGEARVLASETSPALPTADGTYFMARIHEAGNRSNTVRVWVRRLDGRVEVVGIERHRQVRG